MRAGEQVQQKGSQESGGPCQVGAWVQEEEAGNREEV